MRNSVLLLVLLSACASHHQADAVIGGATGAVQVHHNSATELQPAARQRPTPVEAQQPAQSDKPPKRHEHNIEED
jgi:hypothetical protein